MVYNLGILVVLMVSGLFVGWAVHTGVLEFLAGVVLLLMFSYAMAWIGVWLGLSVPTVEVAQQVGFTVLFPITFVSNVFVPIQTLPDFLRPVAEWNPTSTLTAAVRELWGNPAAIDPRLPPPTGLPAEEPVVVTLIWFVVILAVFIPLSVRKYRSVSR